MGENNQNICPRRVLSMMPLYRPIRFRLMGLLLIIALAAALMAYYRASLEISTVERDMVGLNHKWAQGGKVFVNVRNEVAAANVENTADLIALLDDPQYDCSKLRQVLIHTWDEPLPTERLPQLTGIRAMEAPVTLEKIRTLPESLQSLWLDNTTGSVPGWEVELMHLPRLLTIRVDELSEEMVTVADDHSRLQVLIIRSSELDEEELQWAREKLDSVEVRLEH